MPAGSSADWEGVTVEQKQTAAPASWGMMVGLTKILVFTSFQTSLSLERGSIRCTGPKLGPCQVFGQRRVALLRCFWKRTCDCSEEADGS